MASRLFILLLVLKQLKEAEKLQDLVLSMQLSGRKGDLVVSMTEDEMQEFLHLLQNCFPRKLDERKMRKAVGKEVFDYFESFSEYEAFDFPRASSKKNMQMKLNRPVL
jgi:hypothetical protein